MLCSVVRCSAVQRSAVQLTVAGLSDISFVTWRLNPTAVARRNRLFRFLNKTDRSGPQRWIWLMDVPCDLCVYFSDAPVQRLDNTLLKRLNPRKCWIVEKTINNMGARSAAAQGLKKVLTTYDKLIDSEDEQVLYLMWKKIPDKENASIIIGLLKIGYKNLYLTDLSGRPVRVTPLCVLDFYVHESLQRRGYGHALFDYMLEQENSSAERVAIDKPSLSLLQFMNKHYGLNEPLWQNTSFVVYPSFFKDIKFDTVESMVWPVEQSEKTNAIYGRRAFPAEGRDSVGDLLRGDVKVAVMKQMTKDCETPQGRKISRDFGHQSIW